MLRLSQLNPRLVRQKKLISDALSGKSAGNRKIKSAAQPTLLGSGGCWKNSFLAISPSKLHRQFSTQKMYTSQNLIEEHQSEQISELNLTLKLYKLFKHPQDPNPILHYHFEPNSSSISNLENCTIGLVNPTEYHPIFQQCMEKLLTIKDKKHGTFLNFDNIKHRLLLEKMGTEMTSNRTTAVVSGQIPFEVLQAFEVLIGSVYSGAWDEKDFLNNVKRYELGGETEGLGLAGQIYEQEKLSLSDMEREFLEILDLSRRSHLSFCPRVSAYTNEEFEPATIVKFSGIEPIRGPARLLKVEYKELRSWYERNYQQQAKLKIFSYGKIDPAKIQQTLFNSLPSLAGNQYPILPQASSAEFEHQKSAISVHKKYPPNPYGQNSMYGINFNIGTAQKIKNIDLEILSFIFFDTPYSPFFNRFIQGNTPIANGFCPNFGFNPENSSFTIGFQDLVPFIDLDDPQFSWFDKSKLTSDFNGGLNFGTVTLTKDLLHEMIMQTLEYCLSSDSAPHNFPEWVLQSSLDYISCGAFVKPSDLGSHLFSQLLNYGFSEQLCESESKESWREAFRVYSSLQEVRDQILESNFSSLDTEKYEFQQYTGYWDSILMECFLNNQNFTEVFLEVDQSKRSEFGDLLSYDKYGVLVDQDLEAQEKKREKQKLIKEQEIINLKMARERTSRIEEDDYETKGREMDPIGTLKVQAIDEEHLRNLGFSNPTDYQSYEIALLNAKLGEFQSNSIQFEQLSQVEHIEEVYCALSEIFEIHSIDKILLDQKKEECISRAHSNFRKFSDSELDQILKDEVWLKEHNSQLLDLNNLPKSNIFTLRDYLAEQRDFLEKKIGGKNVNSALLSKESGLEIEFEEPELSLKGLVYLKTEIDFTALLQQKPDLLLALFLMERIFTRIGTFSMKPQQFQLKIRQCITDIEFRIENIPGDTYHQGKLKGCFRIGFLESNYAEAVEVLTSILTEPDFGEYENLSQQIRIISSELAQELVDRSQDMAMIRALKECHPAYAQWNDLDNTRNLINTATKLLQGLHVKKNLDTLVENMEEILRICINSDSLKIKVFCHESMERKIDLRLRVLEGLLQSTYPRFSENNCKEFLAKNERETCPKITQEAKTKSPTYIRHYSVVPGDLNTISETFFTDTDSPQLAVFAKLLEIKGLEEFRRKKGPENQMKAIYDELTGHLTIQSLKDREVLKVYTQFEKAIIGLLNRNFKDSDLIQAKILVVKETFEYLKPKLSKNTSDLQKLQKVKFTLRCLDVTQQEMIDSATSNIHQKIKAGQSSQVVYGKASENLEMYVSQGWTVERFAKGLSISKEKQLPQLSAKLKIFSQFVYYEP